MTWVVENTTFVCVVVVGDPLMTVTVLGGLPPEQIVVAGGVLNHLSVDLQNSKDEKRTGGGQPYTVEVVVLTTIEITVNQHWFFHARQLCRWGLTSLGSRLGWNGCDYRLRDRVRGLGYGAGEGHDFVRGSLLFLCVDGVLGGGISALLGPSHRHHFRACV